ncbi:hypothetical protein CR513_24374, partial [Mucuna pruriens]
MAFAIKGQEEKVLKLKKVLYDLKQALRAWNSCIDKYFQDNGFGENVIQTSCQNLIVSPFPIFLFTPFPNQSSSCPLREPIEQKSLRQPKQLHRDLPRAGQGYDPALIEGVTLKRLLRHVNP